jgi:peptidoglycan/xylan/chitin deacetylase (PgdA/CDA1 family)
MKIYILLFAVFTFLAISCTKSTEEVLLSSKPIDNKNVVTKTGETLTAILPSVIVKGTTVEFKGVASSTITKVLLNVGGFDLGTAVNVSPTDGTWSKVHNFSSAGINRLLIVKGLSSTGTVLITKTYSITVYNSLIPSTPNLVLMYHQVDPNPKSPDDVTVVNFTQQMQWLKDNGYTTITTEDLFIGALPSKSVLITFDDGYIGNFTNAKPVLENLNMKADFFVHTDYVGKPTTTTGSWDHMSWDQLRTIDASPLFSVYSHTKTHPKLTEITATQLATELAGSKQKVELELGGSRNFLAYPFGDYNLNVISATQSAGYLMAFAVANKGSFNKPLHYSFTRKGIGKDVTNIALFRTRIGA